MGVEGDAKKRRALVSRPQKFVSQTQVRKVVAPLQFSADFAQEHCHSERSEEPLCAGSTGSAGQKQVPHRCAIRNDKVLLERNE
jgi:hypothetical protein